MFRMSNPALITIVLGSLRTGGAEKAMIQLANGLAERFIDTNIVILNNPGELLHLVSRRVNIIDLDVTRAANGIGAFRKYLRRHKPDVLIVAQTHVQVMASISVLLSGWKGILILNEHSLFSFNNHKISLKLLGRIFFNRANAITAVSKAVADDFVSNFRNLKAKVSIVPNVVFVDDILRLREENILLTGSKPFILSAGRLTKSKNYRLLIDAFALVIKESESSLIILGEGEERESLETYAAKIGLEKLISFPGNVINPYAYMNRCSVFVLSSLYEGLPTVLIEALACGCNIVSTDCPGGAAEILQDGKFGTLVENNNAVKLSQAILLDMNGKSDVEEKLLRTNEFTTEKIVDTYISLIKNLMNGQDK